MLNRYARAFFSALFTPIARGLLRIGLTPNAVTVIGTLGVCAGALIFYPMGELFWGTVFITLFVFSDSSTADGTAEREGLGARGLPGLHAGPYAGRSRVPGAAHLVLHRRGAPMAGHRSAACLLLGGLVSYVRAKAESLGYTADVGIAERPERMVLTLVFTGFTGLGLPPEVLLAVLTLLAAASMVTVVQRMAGVFRQSLQSPR